MSDAELWVTGAALLVAALSLLVAALSLAIAVRADRRADRADRRTRSADLVVPMVGGEPEVDADGQVMQRLDYRIENFGLAMVLDHHGIQPNPARDPRVKLPREEKVELNPPSAADVLAVHDLLPPKYRLPLLVLDGTGCASASLSR